MPLVADVLPLPEVVFVAGAGAVPRADLRRFGAALQLSSEIKEVSAAIRRASMMAIF